MNRVKFKELDSSQGISARDARIFNEEQMRVTRRLLGADYA